MRIIQLLFTLKSQKCYFSRQKNVQALHRDGRDPAQAAERGTRVALFLEPGARFSPTPPEPSLFFENYTCSGGGNLRAQAAARDPDGQKTAPVFFTHKHRRIHKIRPSNELKEAKMDAKPGRFTLRFPFNPRGFRELFRITAPSLQTRELAARAKTSEIVGGFAPRRNKGGS